MKISVIIPVYNVSAYLEQCVRSVQVQTYRDVEIILVDDGSTDTSGCLCDRLATEDERIRVVHKQNGGLSDARNVGLSNATGEYVAFLDGDDVWLEADGLQQMVNLLLQKPTDVLLFRCVDIYPNRQKSRPKYSEEYVLTHSVQEVFSRLVRTQVFNMSACFQLIRRALLEDKHLYFEVGLLSEDVEWSLRLWREMETVGVSNMPMYGYQHRSDSITTSYSICNLRAYDHIFRVVYARYDVDKETCSSALYWQTALGYLAQMYTSCLYAYFQIAYSDRKEAMSILCSHAYLLRYSISAKSNRVVKCRRLIGLHLTIYLFAIYGSLKRRLMK